MKEKENISSELLETIERYYNHSMTEEEKLAFEAKLQQDATFKQEVEDIKILLFSIESQSLKEKLNEFHEDLPLQMETNTSSSKVRFLNFRNIAAAVVIVMASISFWFFNGSSNQRLYSNYFKPDPGLPTTMSTSDNYAFYDAMVNYKQGNYKTAILKWKKLDAKKPNNDTLTYFLGVAHLANDEVEKAMPFLEKSSTNVTSVFANDANYYLGLAFLKKDKKEQAIQSLNKSTTKNSKKLLKELQ